MRSTSSLYRYLHELLDSNGIEVHHDHDGDEVLFHNETEAAALNDSFSEHSDKPYGLVIGAAFIVQLVTLSGLVIVAVVSSMSHFQTTGPDEARARPDQYVLSYMIPSCAVGALLATTLFLITPEALSLIQTLTVAQDGHEELTGAWKFGVAALVGVLVPIVLGTLFERPTVVAERVEPNEQIQLVKTNHVDADSVRDEVEGNETPPPTAPNSDGTSDSDGPTDEAADNAEPGEVESWDQRPGRDIPLAVSLLAGDFLHNVSDGFFIGTAFLLCSPSLAWTIVASTIYHELCQELGDYVLLTQYCGLSMTQALLCNFVAGSSVWVGAVTVLWIDLSNEAIGWILSLSAGVYLHIAVGECVPRLQALRKTSRDTLIFVACFTLGAVPIGLVLLNHGHCEGDHVSHTSEPVAPLNAVDSHAGHDH